MCWRNNKVWLGLGVRVESIENGDPIRTDGEQARPNSSCSILRIPHSRRATCPRRRNRSQMPRPQRTAGSLISISITIHLDPIQIQCLCAIELSDFQFSLTVFLRWASQLQNCISSLRLFVFPRWSWRWWGK